MARANLEAATSFIPDRYEAGVKLVTDFPAKAGSDQAEKNFATAINKAVANKTRQKMLKKISNEDWQNKAINVGKDRIASGIVANLDKYDKNFSPVLTAMNQAAQQVEGKRTTDPMANIDNILKPVVKAAVAASPRA